MHDETLASAPYRSAKPGEIITLGHYPQTADGTDRTPIQWRVLRNSGAELFLLSEYLLDCRRYAGEYADITWHDSALRKWLNEAFYHAAFDESEKGFIQTTLCTDNGGPDTEDKVFLLSVPEARELTGKPGDASLVQRRTLGTEFAKIKKDDGCRLYVMDKRVKDDYIIENGEALGCSWWWLRTQPIDASRAFFIGTRSSIRSYGRVNLACYGVRPALRTNLV